MKNFILITFIASLSWMFFGRDEAKMRSVPKVRKSDHDSVSSLHLETTSKKSRFRKTRQKAIEKEVMREKAANKTIILQGDFENPLHSFKRERAHAFEKDIFKASMKGDLLSIKKLVEKGIDLDQKDKNGQTAAFIALDNNHAEIANYLLENGADGLVKNKKGLDLSTVAGLSGEEEIFSRLVELGAPVNSNVLGKMNLLMSSAMEGHFKICEKILKKRPDEINLRDDFGNSALHYAAQGGHDQVIALLVSYNANIDLVNDDDESPLDIVKLNGFSDSLDAMVRE